MGQFSDDGRWWWDGAQWIATSQVVLPDLPMTDFERSGKLSRSRRLMRRHMWLYWLNTGGSLLAGTLWSALAGPALQGYRTWTLEQLALATAYVLGPDEPMLAGEVSILMPTGLASPFERDFAVAVSAAHVLVFRLDSFDGQPRWLALAARPAGVEISKRWTGGVRRQRVLSVYPELRIKAVESEWSILLTPLVSDAKPVLEAWRRASGATAATQ